MAIPSLSEFLSTVAKSTPGGEFELESPNLLNVNLSQSLWLRIGTLVAYAGDVVFQQEDGLSPVFTQATGRGRLYLADHSKTISLLRLNDESLHVRATHVLAFEPTLRRDLFDTPNVFAHLLLAGTGHLAITSQQSPLALAVTPDRPICTDPRATLAWTASLTPKFKSNTAYKTFTGRGSGESTQIEFQGTGHVLIQPHEEH